MGLRRAIVSTLVPPLCASCGRHCHEHSAICGRCGRRLEAAEPLEGRGPHGVDRAWSSAPHDGVARDLVAALKFRRLLPVAAPMADRIARLGPAVLLGGTIVPVPTAPARSAIRGFDPARVLASALAQSTGAPFQPCLERVGRGRQVGRRRAERVGRPPRIRASGPVPRSVLLVDDVMTTGATISACARALRAGGAVRVVAVTFSRRL